MTEHVSAGEWERWREDDRAWKNQVMDHLIIQGERLTRVETNAGRAETAASSAESAKKWSIFGNAVGALIHGIFIALGGARG
jgi:hypothetical protein